MSRQKSGMSGSHSVPQPSLPVESAVWTHDFVAIASTLEPKRGLIPHTVSACVGGVQTWMLWLGSTHACCHARSASDKVGSNCAGTRPIGNSTGPRGGRLHSINQLPAVTTVGERDGVSIDCSTEEACQTGWDSF